MIALWMLCAGLAAEPAVAPVEEQPSEVADAPQGPDRSGPPAVIPADFLDLPEPEVHDLGPGRTAWHVRVPGVRKVVVEVYLFAGTVELDGWPTPLAQFSVALADLATASRDAESLEILEDVRDLDVMTYIGAHRGGARVEVPIDDLDLGLDLLREVLHEPAFPARDVRQTLRDNALWLTVQGPASQTAVARRATDFGWFPADHPYGAPADLKALKKVRSGALAEMQARWRGLGPVHVLVVGDVPWSAVEPGLRRVVDGIGRDGERAEELDVPEVAEDRVIAVDMPGQAQTAIRLRYAAPSRRSEDRVAFDAVNWALGGHFLSRLNANLREDKGFTYGTWSSWRPRERFGTLTVGVDVKAENTAAAIREIEGELQRLVADGLTREEIDMAARNAVSDWNDTLQTAGSAAWFYEGLIRDEEAVGDRMARERSIADLTPEATRDVAARWLEDRPHLWVLVGDRAALEPQLDELGLSARWLTPDEAVRGGW